MRAACLAAAGARRHAAMRPIIAPWEFLEGAASGALLRHLPQTHYLHVRGKWAANAPARRRVTAAGTLHRAACLGGGYEMYGHSPGTPWLAMYGGGHVPVGAWNCTVYIWGG